MRKVRAFCFELFIIAIVCVATEAPGSKVTKRYPVPGNGGFDYIVFDSSSNRLYVFAWHKGGRPQCGFG